MDKTLKDQKNGITKNIPLIVFVFSFFFLVFIIGVIAGHFNYFSGTFVEQGMRGLLDWKRNYKHNLRIEPGKHIGNTRNGRQAPFIHRDSASPGVTLLTSFIHTETNSGPGLQLLDIEGNIIHTWFISHAKIFPQAIIHDWDSYITGAELLSNGDVVFNVHEVGTVKLDWCSNVIWKSPLFGHHNISIDEDDNIWTAGKKPLQRKILKTQYPEKLTITNLDVIIQLSPQGQLLKEINVLDVILKSDLKGVLFANGRQQLYHKKGAPSFHFTHMNDVEVLGKEMAKYYPLFNAGDIMVSLRNLNLVMVIDGKTSLAKWWMVGPFLRQHDPDFDKNGRISIFDNMGGGAENNIGFASRIISVDPISRSVDTIYRADPPSEFYTHVMGSHQILPNGNVLVSESLEGRIFEADRQGDIVWQYSTKWTDERVIHPYQAQRYQYVFSDSLNKCE